MKTLLAFYLIFRDAGMFFITFSSENSQLCHKIVKFWTAKATKIIRILYFLSNAGISNKFAKSQCFDKKMTNSMFFHPKTLINTKYKCQKQEKVELKNLYKCSERCVKVLL